MQRKITRDDLLAEIIKLVCEYRTEIEEDTTLGQIHAGVQTVSWVFDWLKEKFPCIAPLPEDKIRALIKGTTMGDLANLAMTLIPEGATFEDKSGEENTKGEGEKKTVAIYCCDSNKSGEPGVSSSIEDSLMSKEEFLKHCADFFDARGTHFNDFEQMHIRIK